MTAADIPPNRAHLAAMLKVFALSPAHFGIPARRELLEYIAIAEDTIVEQSRQMSEDAAEVDRRRALIRVEREVIAHIGRECDRLKTQNASLHELIEAAITAGQQDDGEAISIIRAALEGTS